MEKNGGELHSINGQEVVENDDCPYPKKNTAHLEEVWNRT